MTKKKTEGHLKFIFVSKCHCQSTRAEEKI